ncbi:MAG: PEP-CTERM sorting domain-containing protein [Phycisphaerae bacterium]
MNRTVITAICVLAAAGVASANVGEPFGAGPGNTFSIKVTQGNNVIFDSPNTPFPTDFKVNDGDPEDFVQVGTTPGGTPIIVKVVSDGGPSEAFRIMHVYVDVVSSLIGPIPPFSATDSLFASDPTQNIKVEIGNIGFINTTNATPLVVGNDSFAVSYMEAFGGGFYMLPNTNPFDLFGQRRVDVQVPGKYYLDGIADPYQFSSVPGSVVSWKYENLEAPSPLTPAEFAVSPPSLVAIPGGKVAELGLGIAFVGVPEPATLVLLSGGLLPLIRRRKRA